MAAAAAAVVFAAAFTYYSIDITAFQGIRRSQSRKKQRKCGDMPSMDAQLHVDLVPTSTPEASDGRRHCYDDRTHFGK